MLVLATRPSATAVVSPELALVDTELRAHALASLPPVEPFDFLRLRDLPLPVTEAREARRLVAALAYLLVAMVRTTAFNACVFASVALVVLLLNVI